MGFNETPVDIRAIFWYFFWNTEKIPTRKCIDNTKKAHSFIQCSRIESSLFKAWLIKLGLMSL